MTHKQLCWFPNKFRCNRTGPTMSNVDFLIMIFYYTSFIHCNRFFFSTVLPVGNVPLCEWHIVLTPFTVLCGLMPTFCLKRVWKDLVYEKMMLSISSDIIWAPASWITPDTLRDTEQNRKFFNQFQQEFCYKITNVLSVFSF